MRTPLWMDDLKLRWRAWRRERQWQRQRVSIAQPVYRPGYVPGVTWWQIALAICGLVIIGLLAALYLRENYWRYKYRDNPTFVTTYNTPRSTPADKDSHYAADCSDKSTPSGLSKCVGFTSEGQKLLDKLGLSYVDEAKVAQECGVADQVSESMAIFGCWTLRNGTEKISLLAADDPLYGKFKESPEVTLAHEFLHAVYYRLSMSEQQQVFSALSAEYGDMLNEIIGLGYDYADVDDELFTRVGSEQTKAPDVAKQIYAKYLTKWSGQTANNSGDQTGESNDGQGGATPADSQPVPTTPTPQPAAPANHTNGGYTNLQSCNVTRVSDGDTFYVDCLPQRVRLIGVDTPESTNKHQCFGNEASSKTHGLAGQKVYLESDPVSGDTDTYGRYLRYVYLADGTNYNMQLIEDGYGMLYVFKNQQFQYRDKFASAESAARSAGKGLWSACQTAINKYGNYQVVN